MSKNADKAIDDNLEKIDCSSKSIRQEAFRAECKRLGLSPKETAEKASLFNGVDASRFKLVRMPP